MEKGRDGLARLGDLVIVVVVTYMLNMIVMHHIIIFIYNMMHIIFIILLYHIYYPIYDARCIMNWYSCGHTSCVRDDIHKAHFRMTDLILG